MAYNQTLRPKPFDGSGTQDIEDFLHTFEMYSNFAEWGERKKINALKSNMVENAGRWLQRQEIDNDITYEELVQLIRDKYNISPAQRFHLRTELSCIRQLDQEMVDQYADRVEQLCNRLDITDQEVQTHQFVQGLKNNIRPHVIRSQPTTMEAALNAARAEEGAQSQAVLNDTGTTTKSKPDIDLLADAVAQKLSGLNFVTQQTVAAVRQNSSVETCQLCNRQGHTARQCHSLQQYAAQYPEQDRSTSLPYGHAPPTYQGPPPPPPPPPRRYKPRHQVQCYNCGNFGHYRRECLQRFQQGNAQGLTVNRN